MRSTSASYILCAVALLAGCERQSQLSSADRAAMAARVVTQQKTKDDSAAATREADCKTNTKAKVDAYTRQMARKEYWAAATDIRLCAGLLDEPKLKAMLSDAEVRSYKQDIANPKTSDFDKVRAIQALQRDYPNAAKPFEAQVAKLTSQVDRKAAANAAQMRKNTTPPIGASSSAILADFWGYPQSVNRTTTARGVHEQWVYGLGKYLYFDNGVLTAVQE